MEMSTVKKISKKRKYASPTPTSSEIGRRLEKLRSMQGNLWDDEDDDRDLQPCVQPKTTTATATTNNKTYIVLSDSDDEKAASRRRDKATKPRKKIARDTHEHDSCERQAGTASLRCATCLICSLLTTLTPYNCCSKHLAILLNSKSPQSTTTASHPWPPQQVMIVPMTDELLQRYLDPQQIHSLKTQRSTSPVKRKRTKRNESSRPDGERSKTSREKTSTNRRTPSGDMDVSGQTNASSIATESPLPALSGAMPADTTFTVVASSSTATGSSFESPSTLNTCQMQSSSEQAIVFEDTQPDHQQPKKTSDVPRTTTTDEPHVTMDVVVDRIDLSVEEPTEFTPATVRRTATEVMASRLPKIQLKQGRYRQGKPIAEPNPPANATVERRSLSTAPSPSTASVSVVITSIRPSPSPLATIIEDESLIVAPSDQASNKSSHGLSQRHENITEGLSDTMMSCLFAQDEASQQDYLAAITKPVANDGGPVVSSSSKDTSIAKDLLHHRPPPPTIVIEDYSRVTSVNPSTDLSQFSQMSNEQNESQPVLPSISVDKTTPVRISYRTNPDGSRVGISRPTLTSSHPSPLISLSRILNGVASTTYHPSK